MNKDNHLIYESLVQSRAPISDEQAAKMIAHKIKGTPNLSIQNIKMYVQRYMDLTGKAPSDVDFIASMVHDNLQHMGMGENAEEPHGYPQGMTAIQNLLLNELKKRGFELTKISHEDKERDKYPTVFMHKKDGPMHKVAEICGMGTINGEPYKEYMMNLKHAQEDAEHRSPAQQAAIAISLQKAGKKPS